MLSVARILRRHPKSLSTSLCTNAKKRPSKENKYGGSVLLPETKFDQRANAEKREPELQKYWNDTKLFELINKSNSGGPYVLHDGPPYANGDLHIGHALNKVLKDIICKYQLLRGRQVHYTPGWDCHGLPIELKVLQSMKQAERDALGPLDLRKKAAEFAAATITSQRVAFQRYGVWGNWTTPYTTMTPSYEARQIRVFGQMLLNGYIYRGRKPVHWSPSSRTALAEAELEYAEAHVSKSLYLGFRVATASPALQPLLSTCSDPRIAIWTTTPWTIPSNQAVAVHANIEYSLIRHPSWKAQYIVASDLVRKFATAVMGLDAEAAQSVSIIGHLLGSELSGTSYHHPLDVRIAPVVIGGDYITTESGTGLVHTAPGHGHDDYLVGLKNNLEIFSPVDDAGKFTDEVHESLRGKNVLSDGNDAVITLLQDSDTLLKQEAYTHRYPYDWRTKKPTIFRATSQWFASVSSFRSDVVAAINSVTWVPEIGRNRIHAMVDSRGDWCISRQRCWGVPIPVFYHKKTGDTLATQETVEYIEQLFATHGSNAWWEKDVVDLLPPSLKSRADEYEKGTDTMDVWFDSGTSWAGVLEQHGLYPADLYLEGSDQHRGWFQSSLLTSVAVNKIAPYRTVLTHGFVLDEKGSKMSKSLGNVIDPYIVINGNKKNIKEQPPYGADTLRLWIASCDYSRDVSIGPNIIKSSSESYRKIRNTMRFLLGSLSDFSPKEHAVSFHAMPLLDQYMLATLSSMFKEVDAAYSSYQFYHTLNAISLYCIKDLSSFYCDISKDRLYVSRVDDVRRRSCQTVMHYILEYMTLMMAPVVPHLAEDIWQHMPYKVSTASVFQQGWIDKKAMFSIPEEKVALMQKIMSIRNDVNSCVEAIRRSKEIGASAESEVFLHTTDAQLNSMLLRYIGGDAFGSNPNTNTVDDLRIIFMVSQVSVANTAQDVAEKCPVYLKKSEDSESGVTVGVRKVSTKKCDRCWYFSTSVGEDNTYGDVCVRCASVLHSSR